jgi:hypothetical protein
VFYELLSDSESIGKLIFDVLRSFDRFSHHIKSSRLNSDPNGLVELAINEASLKHSIDDCLHLRVNKDDFLFLVIESDSLFDVFVNTFVDECINILRSFIQVKLAACFECQSQGLLVLF